MNSKITQFRALKKLIKSFYLSHLFADNLNLNLLFNGAHKLFQLVAEKYI